MSLGQLCSAGCQFGAIGIYKEGEDESAFTEHLQAIVFDLILGKMYCQCNFLYEETETQEG